MKITRVTLKAVPAVTTPFLQCTFLLSSGREGAQGARPPAWEHRTEAAGNPHVAPPMLFLLYISFAESFPAQKNNSELLPVFCRLSITWQTW